MITVTPWTERKFNFDYPVGLYPIILERLRGTLPRLASLVKDIPEEKLNQKKDGKWSVKEVIGHLSDIESLWSSRIDDFLEGKDTLRKADMTNQKTHDALHNEKNSAALLEQFQQVRKQFIKKVESFDEKTASITALHPRLQKPMRLIDSLFFAAEHDDHELNKIRSLLIG